MALCALSATWDQLVARKRDSTGPAFKTGPLGMFEDRPRWKVRICARGTAPFRGKDPQDAC